MSSNREVIVLSVPADKAAHYRDDIRRDPKFEDVVILSGDLAKQQ